MEKNYQLIYMEKQTVEDIENVLLWTLLKKTWREKRKMPNWTKEQKQAIYEKNSNLLIAAAAGSRKNGGISRKNYKQSNK